MYTWEITLTFDDGKVSVIPLRGVSFSGVLRTLEVLNERHALDFNTAHIDLRKVDLREVKEHQDAE